MITVKMTEHDIRGVFQCLDDPLPHPFTCRNLARMGEQAMPQITQCHPGINDDPPGSCCNQTAQAANP
jgi:hypothetical protein